MQSRQSRVEETKRAYVDLLRHADVGTFERLLGAEPETTQLMLYRANERRDLFFRLPGTEVIAHLIEMANRGSRGPIAMSDLPGEDDYEWVRIILSRYAPQHEANA